MSEIFRFEEFEFSLITHRAFAFKNPIEYQTLVVDINPFELMVFLSDFSMSGLDYIFFKQKSIFGFLLSRTLVVLLFGLNILKLAIVLLDFRMRMEDRQNEKGLSREC